MAKKKTAPKSGDKAKTGKTTSPGRKTPATKAPPAKTRPTRGLKADILDLMKASPAVTAHSPHQIHAKLKAQARKAPSLGAVKKAFASLEASGHIEPLYALAAPPLNLESTVYAVLKSLPGGCGTPADIKQGVDGILPEPVSLSDIEGALWVLCNDPNPEVQKVDGRYCVCDGSSNAGPGLWESQSSVTLS